MAGEEEKTDMMFEVVCFGWTGDSMTEDFEADGISVHVENVCIAEETTAISPLQVDAVVFACKSKDFPKAEVSQLVSRYRTVPLKIWLQEAIDDFNVDLILREEFLLERHSHKCQKLLKQFFTQLCAFVTKLMGTLDLKETKTVEFEDLVVFAEQFEVELKPQDLESFLTEYQNEGDSFLTARGVLKWVKVGKADCKVGTVIRKVMQAKNLLKGFPITVKRLFLGPDLPANPSKSLKGDVQITIGETDFVPGAKAEMHIWSRSKLPQPHPADLLGLSPTEGNITFSVKLPRNPTRTFSQIQDYMRNLVYKVESLISLLGYGEGELLLTVDYRITDSDATFYLIPDHSLIASNDSSFRREFRPIVNALNGNLGYEVDLEVETKAGFRELLSRAEEHFQDFVVQGVRAALRYTLDSNVRDLIFSFPTLLGDILPFLLVSELNLKSHFEGLSDLPQALQKLIRRKIPSQASTFASLLSLFGRILNKECKDYAIEKQVELVLRTAADLFDLKEIQAELSYFNLVGQVKLHFPGLEDFARLDIGEIRRKAAEADRAKKAGSESESKSDSEDSNRQRMAKLPKPMMECTSEQGPSLVLRMGSISKSSSERGSLSDLEGKGCDQDEMERRDSISD